MSFFPRFASLFLASVLGVSAQAAFATPLPPPKDQPSPDSPAYIAEDPHLSSLIGKPAPALLLKTLDGQDIDLSRFYGRQPVYLKLWATYCIPCRAQMPGFEKLYGTYKDRIHIIAVDVGFGENRNKVATFAEHAGLTMPVVMDDGSLSNWLHIKATPLHVLIDRNGRIAYVGHQDGAALETALEKVVNTPRSTDKIQLSTTQHRTSLQIGQKVPHIDLPDATGHATNLVSNNSRVPQAIFFGATWCESYLNTVEPETAQACKHARITLQTLAQDHHLKWTAVAAHLWTELSDLPAYQTLLGPELPVVLDTDGLAFDTFGVTQIPAVALIDSTGHLKRLLDARQRDIASQIQSFIRSSAKH